MPTSRNHPADEVDAGPWWGLDELLRRSRTAAPHELAGHVAACARSWGARDAVAYLVDLEQHWLVPMVETADVHTCLAALDVDGTMAGRAFQTGRTQAQPVAGRVRTWVPLRDGTERLGVLSVDTDDRAAADAGEGRLPDRLERLAAVTAHLVVSKSLHGDTLVTLRRQGEMGLAAEMQWSLLPPLTCSTTAVSIAAAMEPAYRVAGDTVDYSVGLTHTHVAVFDGMGHGLESAQLASLAVSAYRNARRSGNTLTTIAERIDAALQTVFDGTTFTTAVLARLDTATGLLQWLDAGHPEPLLLRGNKVVRNLHAVPSLPLGLWYADPDAVPILGQEQLEPGDRVLLYTDGVVEGRSPQQEAFGAERLGDLVTRHLAGGLPAAETMRRTVRAVTEHQQGTLADDATLLLLGWPGEVEAATPA